VGRNLKINPWPVIRAQHETYVDSRTGRPRVIDYALFDGVPLVIFVVCVWQAITLTPAAAGALLAVSGLLSALLFGVMLQILARAMDWVDAAPTPGRETTEHAYFMRDVAANAAYAAVVCVASAIAYVVATSSGGRTLELASALGIASGTHLVLVLLMVIRRVFALTENRLLEVRTGAAQAATLSRRPKRVRERQVG
jgi:hypothetical protein